MPIHSSLLTASDYALIGISPPSGSEGSPTDLNAILCPETMMVSEEIKETPNQRIPEEELEIFASIFKGRMHLPEYVSSQFKLLSSLSSVTTDNLEDLAVNLPLPPKKKLSNKTLIFDLDNTLVCAIVTSNAKLYPNAIVHRITYFDVKRKGNSMLDVVIRPYAIEMLKQLSNYYEIIIFTAANKSYGDAVMDVLDPDRTLIDHRLYRDNCIRKDNSFIKDLRIINRKLNSLIIVDNNIVSFSNQMENGIFIPSFNGIKPDAELVALWVFLRQIVDIADVRVPIVAKYNLPFLYKMYTETRTW